MLARNSNSDGFDHQGLGSTSTSLYRSHPVIRKRYTVLAVGAVALSAVALLVWQLTPKDHATRISVPQAVQLYRADSSANARKEVSGEARPQFGVYRYETHGEEAVSTSFLSGGHDYDGVSTITLRPGDCGVVERWQVLVGRWRESEGCLGSGGEEAKSLRELHEFFESPQKDAYTCSGPSTSDPANLKPGTNLVTVCKSDTESVVTKMKVSEASPVRIDGELLHPVLVKGTSLIEGSSAGAAGFEDWRRRSDGLLLRRDVTSHVESDSYGGMNYSEHYGLRLLSVIPER
jgi:hypothetical protein